MSKEAGANDLNQPRAVSPNGERGRARNRYVSGLCVILLVSAGLASRRLAWLLPGILRKNLGDILWAGMVYCVLGFLLPRLVTWRLSVAAVVFCFGIEASKFYHAPWFDAVRGTGMGRLVFGYVFSWSNLICYLIGIVLAVGCEQAVNLWRFRHSK